MKTDTYPSIPTVPPGKQPPRRRRRFSGAQRFILFLLGVTAIGVFATIGYVTWTEGKIDRIAAEDLQSLSAITPLDDGEPVNFLVVGTDDRSTLPDDWDDAFGEFAGRRADVIMLAHMVPGERIQLLSLPRDLKVSIPGHGTNRINAAYVFGGPDLLVQTVQGETGIPIHHYVEIDFAGFGSVVDSVGGVPVSFPYPVRDPKSGFSADAGSQRIGGEQAVAYARSRSMQQLKDGSWQDMGGGDIARTGRQRELLILMFDQITSPSSAFNLPSFLPTFADQITADEGLSLGQMADLGRTALSLRSNSIESATLPVRNTKGEDGRAYVEPVDGARALLDAFVAGLPFPT